MTNQLDRVVSKVQVVCNTLGGVETVEVSRCVDGLRSSCLGTVINKVLQTEKIVHMLQDIISKLTSLYSSVRLLSFLLFSPILCYNKDGLQ